MGNPISNSVCTKYYKTKSLTFLHIIRMMIIYIDNTVFAVDVSKQRI